MLLLLSLSLSLWVFVVVVVVAVLVLVLVLVGCCLLLLLLLFLSLWVLCCLLSLLLPLSLLLLVVKCCYQTGENTNFPFSFYYSDSITNSSITFGEQETSELIELLVEYLGKGQLLFARFVYVDKCQSVGQSA